MTTSWGWAGSRGARRPVVTIALLLVAASITAGVSTNPAVARTTRNASAVAAAGLPPARIRVANFYLLPTGKPGPALDFYDSPRPGKADKALIAHLGYGQLSKYVSPRVQGVLSDYVNLYLFPAGSKQAGPKVDGLQAGTNITNAGWLAGEQQTIVLGPSTGTSYVGVTMAPVDEVEPAHMGFAAVIKPPAGKGLLAVNQSGLIALTAKYGGINVRVDGQCPQRWVQMVNVDNYVLTPGTHTMNVVADPKPGLGLSQQQCQAAGAVATVTVKVSRRAPTIVFVYGPSPFHAKLLATTVG